MRSRYRFRAYSQQQRKDKEKNASQYRPCIVKTLALHFGPTCSGSMGDCTWLGRICSSEANAIIAKGKIRSD